MDQRLILSDYQMCEFLRCKVRVVDVPTKLLFISFSLQLQIKMDRYKHLLQLTRSFFRDIGHWRSQDELFVYCFVESGISWTAGVQTIQPLGQSVFNFDVMAFDFALQPEGKSGVVYSCLAGHVNLLYVVLG